MTYGCGPWAKKQLQSAEAERIDICNYIDWCKNEGIVNPNLMVYDDDLLLVLVEINVLKEILRED